MKKFIIQFQYYASNSGIETKTIIRELYWLQINDSDMKKVCEESLEKNEFFLHIINITQIQ